MDKALSLAQADEAARKCLAGLITPMQASRLLTSGFLEPDPRNPMWSRFNGANGPLPGFYSAADEADRVYFLGDNVERWHPDVREQKRQELAEAEARMTPPVYAACKALLEYAQSVLSLKPHETALVGHWIAEGGRVLGDPTCERIRWLTEHYLVQVAYSRSGGRWETLFQDPNDGRLWERTYPQSNMHGGGPPRLSLLAPEQVAARYDEVALHKS